MTKRAIILFSLVGILIISTAGYLGFSTTKTPEPTPTPQTVSVTSCDVEQTVTAPRLKLADVQGRALVIHEGGDNYTDNPENGGGKGRVACGVVPKQ